MDVPNGTSSSLFQEQSTTARPLLRIRSASSLDTLRVPDGLRITPGKGTPEVAGRCAISVGFGARYLSRWCQEGRNNTGIMHGEVPAQRQTVTTSA